MPSDQAIQASHLSKCYHIYEKPRHRLLQSLLRGRRRLYREFWALRNISFDVPRGRTVGIVGRNGSGKSTLLQLICGTLTPTSGELIVNGRVAALLDLGAGFNPEFTGRENVYINGAIIGLTDDEIDRRFDGIAAFADIGMFIDQPVKTYSSGMYARLAFAVAINVDPDILVVDEALSVGDEAFQRKCFSRMHQIRENGGTILLVSHSAAQIVEFCDVAVLLDQGERLLTGEPKLVMAKYQKLAYATADQAGGIREGIRALEEGNGTESEGVADSLAESFGPAATVTSEPRSYFDPNLKPQSTVEYVPHGAHIQNVRVLDNLRNQVNVLVPGHEYSYAYDVVFGKRAFRVRCGMLIKTIAGVELGGIVSHAYGSGISVIAAGTKLSVKFRFKALLTPGVYFLNAGIVGWLDDGEHYLHRILDAVMIRIEQVSWPHVTGYVDLSSEPSCLIYEDSTTVNVEAGIPS